MCTATEVKKNLSVYTAPPDNFPATRRAAVLVILQPNSHGNLDVVLTQRAFSLSTYPGDVALPGGKVETGESLEDAAIRETNEEIGFRVPAPIARFDPILSGSNLIVTPFITVLDSAFTPVLNPEEVSRVFTHPLSGFLSNRPPQGAPVPDLTFNDYHDSFDIQMLGRYPMRIHRFETNVAPVFGVTANILINIARVAYKREPEFDQFCPGQLSYHEMITDAVQRPPWIASL